MRGPQYFFDCLPNSRYVYCVEAGVSRPKLPLRMPSLRVCVCALFRQQIPSHIDHRKGIARFQRKIEQVNFWDLTVTPTSSTYLLFITSRAPTQIARAEGPREDLTAFVLLAAGGKKIQALVVRLRTMLTWSPLHEAGG